MLGLDWRSSRALELESSAPRQLPSGNAPTTRGATRLERMKRIVTIAGLAAAIAAAAPALAQNRPPPTQPPPSRPADLRGKDVPRRPPVTPAMTPDERRDLRRDIRDHGRDVYRDAPGQKSEPQR
jgi:hypothetical protein